MKLGSQTGSLTNHLYSRMVVGQPTVVVGMGATLLRWTDRTACTIVRIDGKYITVQRDHAKRIDKNGMSECQDYEYSPDTEGACYTFKQEKDGRWSEVIKNEETGRFVKIKGGLGLRIGHRDSYHDYSF